MFDIAHEKLIAKLRNRATAYSPQNQQETMLEAARVIEEYDRAADYREPPTIDADEESLREMRTTAKGTLHPGCMECCCCCHYCAPDCRHPNGMSEPNPTDHCSRWAPKED